MSISSWRSPRCLCPYIQFFNFSGVCWLHSGKRRGNVLHMSMFFTWSSLSAADWPRFLISEEQNKDQLERNALMLRSKWIIITRSWVILSVTTNDSILQRLIGLFSLLYVGKCETFYEKYQLKETLYKNRWKYKMVQQEHDLEEKENTTWPPNLTTGTQNMTIFTEPGMISTRICACEWLELYSCLYQPVTKRLF